jgi:hypothetical protein
MRGLILFGFLISAFVVCVLSENDQSSGATHEESSDVAVRADQLTHGHRTKRSPYDPIVPALLLGKSFLVGALVGKSLRRGWGWRPRPRGWGWRAPVVVHHSHSHGGWGGWEAPQPVVSTGWGWAR